MNAIYMTNTSPTTVLANSVIPCSVNKRAGGQNAFIFLNSNVLIKKPGYYEINSTVTFSAAEAGNITIVVQKNGQNVEGITATETITTADTEVRTVYLHGFVKVGCHEDIASICIFNDTDINIDITNAVYSIIG